MVKNTGLKPATGYSIQVYPCENGKAASTPVYKNLTGEQVNPSSSSLIVFDWTMPENLAQLDTLSLYIKVQEAGMEETTEYTSQSIDIKPVYALTECVIEERTDGFYTSFTVTNTGNVDANARDDDVVVIGFNDLYHAGTVYEPFMKASIGDLAVNETRSFVIPVQFNEKVFEYGYVNVFMEVQDKKGETISNTEIMTVELDFPYYVIVNGDAALSEIRLKTGEKTALSGTYSPSDFYSGGELAFAVDDETIAYVDEEGKPAAVSEGTTNLHAAVVPYGGEKTISVTVIKRSPNNSGSSSKPAAKPSTTTNPDGSTTQTTVDQKTGDVTTVTKLKDGTTGTVVTADSGTIKEASVSISSAAVQAASAAGKAVTLPVEIPVSDSAASAPKVNISVPESSAPVKVEIPVIQVTPGTVAIRVNADGSETILTKSVVTEKGIALAVQGDVTLKIVDNSKTFQDISGISAEFQKAVACVSSRELFLGTSAETFSPNLTMTRQMLMTVPARLEGVDARGSDAYARGMAWATENGISDGSNPEANIFRQQLATMLWRYAGSPSVTGGDLSRHTDAGKVAAYATEAIQWCVQNGILKGTSAATLDPEGPATRAQVATFIMRFNGAML